MAPLSELSIGFIVGGAVLSAVIIISFIIWKVIDVKRRAKSHTSSRHDVSTRFENSSSNGNSINQRPSIEVSRTESVYSQIIFDDDAQRVTIIEDSYSTVFKRNPPATDESKEDSGYDGSNFVVDEPEQYSRLHEIINHVEHVYGELSCYAPSESSKFTPDSYTCNPIIHQERDYLEVASPNKAVSNERDEDNLETTPITSESSKFTPHSNSSHPISHQERDYLEVASPNKAVSNERDKDNLETTPITSESTKDMDMAAVNQEIKIIQLHGMTFPPTAVVVQNTDDEDTDDSDEGSINTSVSQITSL